MYPLPQSGSGARRRWRRFAAYLAYGCDRARLATYRRWTQSP